MMIGIFPFVRRQNFDASVDSICSSCYQTIASVDRSAETALVSAEQHHVCSPYAEFDHPHWELVLGRLEQRL
jgi:hypothetical protein